MTKRQSARPVLAWAARRGRCLGTKGRDSWLGLCHEYETCSDIAFCVGLLSRVRALANVFLALDAVSSVHLQRTRCDGDTGNFGKLRSGQSGENFDLQSRPRRRWQGGQLCHRRSSTRTRTQLDQLSAVDIRVSGAKPRTVFGRLLGQDTGNFACDV